MDRDAFDRICAALPATFMVVQWQGSHVWKIGRDEEGWRKRSKMFAVGVARGGTDGGSFGFTFKVSPMLGEVLRGDERVGPAPHLPNGGWLRARGEALDIEDARTWLAVSHETVAAGLTKRDRAALGL